MSESDDYAVGYRKPPKHSQFQKGQSGNPGGKRRNLPTSGTSALAKVLAQRVTVLDDGGETRMSQMEALMQELVRKARAGDTRCLKLVLEKLDGLEADDAAKMELEQLCEKAAREDDRRHRAREPVAESSSDPRAEN
ncbi:MAG: DUF5681 domain-containing protein [Rhizomicrobium sp.]|jgi:hypothetical protein